MGDIKRIKMDPWFYLRISKTARQCLSTDETRNEFYHIIKKKISSQTDYL